MNQNPPESSKQTVPFHAHRIRNIRILVACIEFLILGVFAGIWYWTEWDFPSGLVLLCMALAAVPLVYLEEHPEHH